MTRLLNTSMEHSRLSLSKVTWTLSLVFVLSFFSGSVAAQQKKTLTFTDVMKFRTVQHPVISNDGAWIAFTAQPDRGDSEAIVRFTRSQTRYTIANGSNPVFSNNSGWVAIKVNPSMAEVEASENDEVKPKPGMALLAVTTGEVVEVDHVQRFAFSEDGRWLAYHLDEEASQSEGADSTEVEEPEVEQKHKAGTFLVLRRLATVEEVQIPFVRSFAFDESGRYLAYAVAAPSDEQYGLFVRDLESDALSELTIDTRPFGHYNNLAWSESDNHLAFLVAVEDEDGEPGDAEVWVWNGTEATLTVAGDAIPDGWHIPSSNALTWTDDGHRLFFGYRPDDAEDEKEEDTDTTQVFDPYDMEALLADREVDVWHWNDPLINPNQKKRWNREQERAYTAVYHVLEDRTVQLADLDVPESSIPQNPHVMIGRAPNPYLKEVTWDGNFFDLYTIDLEDGAKTIVAERLESTTSLSPEGLFVLFYSQKNWRLYDIENGTTRNLTENLSVPFADEDHDYPSSVPGYGLGGWTAGDEAVLIYDKYDIWLVPTDGGAPYNMTAGEGRTDNRIFRIVQTDPDQDYFENGEEVLLSSYHDKRKNYGFYSARIGGVGITELLEEDKRFNFIAKAEDAGVLLYSRQAYDEFPDLWISSPNFREPQKITSVNPQMEEYAWGTAELVEWNSVDGIPLQGVVIKPGNYEPGKRYPVLVYFYRFFSQRLHEFNEQHVNHRPNFPLYASDGYIVFLPDVRFEIGRPGFSATKCLVPGVQKLIDMGLADPDAIGLHGHSWSGYQTAFVVTQTDIFAAAVAGAPVSNMTSAYGGIRWGTGLARQFQYEKTQSRLGASLWQGRDRYIDNSPLFFADRINTPLLIQHGDEDGAVPWYQSIELYLALRRLGKDAIFLQYRGEDHHLAKYPNKLDYAMKMKEYFDHYLRGEPAPSWITEGMPYNGK